MKASQAAGLNLDPTLVFTGNYRIDSEHRARSALLPVGPDAVLVTNHLMTVGFMSAADEISMRCPDCALVSFDDYPWLGCFRPRLTTVELPKYELDGTAHRMVLETIERNNSRLRTVTLQPQLRVRESSGFMLHSRRVSVAVEKASASG